MNTTSTLSRLLRNYVTLLICSVTILSAEFALAGCPWEGAANGLSAHDGPLYLESSGYRLLANKRWFNDPNYKAGTEVKMGVDVIHLYVKKGACNGLGGLNGKKAALVYKPPVAENVRPILNGYRIPSSAPGVEFEISFTPLDSVPGGFVLAHSARNVNNGALTFNNAFVTPFPLTISVIKTGKFAPGTDTSANQIKADLGDFYYHQADDLSVVATTSNPVRMIDRYFGGNVVGAYEGEAGSPTCEVFDGLLWNAMTNPIILSPVSTSDFSDSSGPGAIDKGARSGQLRFECKGTHDTRPVVYFEASYPFNNGTEGVGMPKPEPGVREDVGVQILLNNNPVQFGSAHKSSALKWERLPFVAMKSEHYGVITSEGYYCQSNCGTDMTGANWVGGGAGVGNNRNETDAIITFKYYQTTRDKPEAKVISVPFTVTIDVQ